MAPLNTRGRGNCFAHLEDVYNCEETLREEQAVAYQQHSEAQFASLRDQIEALSKQVANVGGCREH
jgi:cold shock CspA family protein